MVGARLATRLRSPLRFSNWKVTAVALVETSYEKYLGGLLVVMVASTGMRLVKGVMSKSTLTTTVTGTAPLFWIPRKYRLPGCNCGVVLVLRIGTPTPPVELGSNTKSPLVGGV